MESLKNNVNNIAKDSEELVKKYLRLFSIRQSEKLSLFLGVIATTMILTMLLLVVLVFCSFALASYLNDVLDSRSWGYWIVTALYLILIIWLFYRLFKTGTPLLSNLFAKIIIAAFDLEITNDKTVNGLKAEGDSLNNNIQNDMSKIKTNVEMLRYIFAESLLREFLGLFSFNKKKKKKKKEKEIELDAEKPKTDNKD